MKDKRKYCKVSGKGGEKNKYARGGEQERREFFV